jgi:hypothetical protein
MGTGSITYLFRPIFMFLVGAMGEIDAYDINPSFDDAIHHLGIIRCRP